MPIFSATPCSVVIEIQLTYFISGTPRLCQLFGMEQRRKVRFFISGKHLINDVFIIMTRAELVCVLLACESLY